MSDGGLDDRSRRRRRAILTALALGAVAAFIYVAFYLIVSLR